MLMAVAKKVLKSGQTAEDGGAAMKMIRNIEEGVDLVDRKYIDTILNAAHRIQNR